MKSYIALATLLFIYISTKAQHQFRITDVPIFKSVNDSIEYTNTQNIFQKILAGQIKNMSADSILSQMRMVSERSIIGRKRTYFATRDFIRFDSLNSIHDLSQITTLSIANCKAKRLPKEVFKCKNLEYLELINTNTRKLQKLNKLSKLRSIYILNSRQLNPIKLSKTKSLKTVGMRGENPGAVPRSFGKVRAMEKLDLAYNNLTKFPVGIRNNMALNEMLLGNNSLTWKDERMEACVSLEKLDLQRNKIEIVPSSISGFPNLKKLSLNFNVIERVSPEISNLKKLEQLSFYNNRLSAIPEGIYSLKNLKEIDLYFNQIERIDPQLGNLINLEVLYLSNNRVISLPESIGELKKLSELYLSNNRLSDLPVSLSLLQNLRVIRINNNYLTHAPKDLLKLTKLENIDFSNNKITELPEDVAGLNQLKLLIIVNNPWDIPSMERLPSFIEKLRKREIVVHSN